MFFCFTIFKYLYVDHRSVENIFFTNIILPHIPSTLFVDIVLLIFEMINAIIWLTLEFVY